MAIAVALSLSCSSTDDAQREQKIAAAKKRQEERRASVQSSIDALARKSQALTNWKSLLGSSDFASLNRVYTIDVERIWSNTKSVLFIGILEDVATHDKDNYHLFVRDYDAFFPELRLHIICPKIAVEPVLAAVRKDKESILPGGIAVTARIVRVEHEIFPASEQTKHIIIGTGQCVDILHIGDALEPR
ncbi:MAG: hypothetical protein WBO23_12215 [Burkholderiales bacterium]